MEKLDENEINERPGVLYIDDEEHNLISFKASLRRAFNVYTAINPGEAEKFLDKEDLKVIVSDQRMPDMTGVDFFARIKETKPEPIRILLTGYSDVQAVVDAINKGEVYRYLTKPWKPDDIKAVINQAIELFDLRRENKRLMEELKRVNGQLEFYLRQKLLS